MAKAKKGTAAEVETQVAPAAEAQTTTSVEPVQLTIADLQLLSRIVDLASRRGAFQAAELSQVGDAFNKLSGFLAYVESAQAKDAATTEEAAPAAETVA
jgi:hypothetical protein